VGVTGPVRLCAVEAGSAVLYQLMGHDGALYSRVQGLNGGPPDARLRYRMRSLVHLGLFQSGTGPGHSKPPLNLTQSPPSLGVEMRALHLTRSLALSRVRHVYPQTSLGSRPPLLGPSRPSLLQHCLCLRTRSLSFSLLFRPCTRAHITPHTSTAHAHHTTHTSAAAEAADTPIRPTSHLLPIFVFFLLQYNL
jgi:hypothetical protein